MADFPAKHNGRCLRCHADCYDILVQFAAGHPRAGEPRQLGAMAPWGRQVCFLLTDGSEMAITFCQDCAAGMVPEDRSEAFVVPEPPPLDPPGEKKNPSAAQGSARISPTARSFFMVFTAPT